MIMTMTMFFYFPVRCWTAALYSYTWVVSYSSSSAIWKEETNISTNLKDRQTGRQTDSPVTVFSFFRIRRNKTCAHFVNLNSQATHLHIMEYISTWACTLSYE